MSEPAQHVPRYTLPRAARVTSKRDYQRVFAVRSSEADSRLIVYAAGNGLGLARVGLVVSKRLGGAVVRNKYKRLLREAFRLTRNELPAGIDYLLLPRGGAGRAPATLEQYRQSLRTLATRAAKHADRSNQGPDAGGQGPDS